MMHDNKRKEWDQSYVNRDNFVFYPHEEVIRFVSKFIVKRIGLKEFHPVHPHAAVPKVLDVGCGIGRHVFYCFQMGLDAYGIDLSNEAIHMARQWAEDQNFLDSENKIVQGDIRQLPWEDGSFQYSVSHGVFDSMYFSIAKQAFKEVARILQTDGLFYCDLVSGDDSHHSREFSGEEVVETQHEKGTIQTYYNYSKILELVGTDFEILEANLVRRENVTTGAYTSRYHLILKK
jgi:SAM-dependent methyltransferase